MKKKFYQFLRDKKCLLEYLINGCGTDKMYTLTEVLKERPEDAICCAFGWGDTTEGYDFWSNLSDQWENLIRK